LSCTNPDIHPRPQFIAKLGEGNRNAVDCAACSERSRDQGSGARRLAHALPWGLKAPLNTAPGSGAVSKANPLPRNEYQATGAALCQAPDPLHAPSTERR